MVLRREQIEIRLSELAIVIQQLEKYRDMDPEVFKNDLEKRWIIERGLEAGAQLVLGIGDHILSGHFGCYAETYESILHMLFEKNVISEDLYQGIKGVGSLRNILVHHYIRMDPDLILESYHKALRIFPLFAHEICQWLDDAENDVKL